MEPIETTQITGIWPYLKTVDWTDPWFSALFGFHILLFLITFLTMKRQMIQAFHFLFLLIMVYLAEQINELAAKHYQLFSRQQYFDSQGMFISIVFSAPLLVNCLIIVMSWILTSSQLMVATGRLRLEHERRLKSKQETKKDS